MRLAYVYKITSPSGKIYIGSTINVERRKKDYQRLRRTHQWKIKSSIEKYGWENHLFEIVWCGDENLRYEKEFEIGNSFNVLDREKGLNLKLPKIDDKIKFLSDETIDRMKKGHLGKSAYWNNSVISCYTRTGEYIETFKSLKDACAKYGIFKSHLQSVLNGRLMTYHDKQWRYGDSKENIESIMNHLRKPKHDKIGQYDLNDNLINVFNSINEISEQLKVKSTSNIYECINNNRKTCYGYKWKLFKE